jgi:2',3'-cyclic-nucleotide 2'-phosphodiesterase (5'-nucleotidase family)
VTWGQLFTIQPFGNTLVTMKLTGDQIRQVLEQQWLGQSYAKVQQIAGISYTYSKSAAAGSKVSNVLVGGVPLDLAKTYTVTANNFLSDGGDGFAAFKLGTNKVVGVSDIDALVDYIKQLATAFNETIQNRIQVVP